MKLQDLNTSNFVYDPKSKDFLKEISKIPEFNDYKEKNRKEIFTWIVVMWDLNTATIREFPNYYMQKYACAEMASFRKKKGGKFQEAYEKILTGTDVNVNKLIAAFLARFHPEYAQLKAFLAMQQGLNEKIQNGEYDNQTPKTLDFIAQKIIKLTNNIFGSGEYNEVSEARKALYAKAENDRLSDRLRAEGVVMFKTENGVLPDDFNQYPDEEMEDVELNFLGDGSEIQ